MRDNKYKEINELLENSRNGCRESLNILVTRLDPLIKSKIKKYYYKIEEFNDLYQEGVLIVILCIKKYDKNKNIYFLGYVKSRLKYYYLDCNKRKEELSLNNKVSEDLELLDTLISEEDSIDNNIIDRESKKTLLSLLLILTKRERKIINLYYFYDLSMKEISNKLNISYRTVVNIKSNGIKKLRSHI